MSELKGSQTEKNLLTAFAGESQARNRYSYFAKQAQKEGLLQIATIFERTANQEQSHAKRLFKFLEGGEVEITARFPAGIIGTTLENLEAAAAGEQYEHSLMYPEFSKIAQQEGFSTIAAAFTAIAKAEKQHEKQYRDFMKNIQSGQVYKRADSVLWYCAKCGYIHEGTEPPQRCPACDHPQSYYQLLAENW